MVSMLTPLPNRSLIPGRMGYIFHIYVFIYYVAVRGPPHHHHRQAGPIGESFYVSPRWIIAQIINQYYFQVFFSFFGLWSPVVARVLAHSFFPFDL